MTEITSNTTAFSDLINSWDFGFGTIFGLRIELIIMFFLMVGVLYRMFGFPNISFDISNLRTKNKSKKIGLIKKILLHLKLAEVKESGKG